MLEKAIQNTGIEKDILLTNCFKTKLLYISTDGSTADWSNNTECLLMRERIILPLQLRLSLCRLNIPESMNESGFDSKQSLKNLRYL